jgi:hypothetical protein
MNLDYISIDLNTTDILTNSLSRTKFEKHQATLEMQSFSILRQIP